MSQTEMQYQGIYLQNPLLGLRIKIIRLYNLFVFLKDNSVNLMSNQPIFVNVWMLVKRNVSFMEI